MQPLLPAPSYVVAEIDPEATLRGSSNPDVRSEIEALKPLKCLMYLDGVRSPKLAYAILLTHYPYRLATYTT